MTSCPTVRSWLLCDSGYLSAGLVASSLALDCSIHHPNRSGNLLSATLPFTPSHGPEPRSADPGVPGVISHTRSAKLRSPVRTF